MRNGCEKALSCASQVVFFCVSWLEECEARV